jgi:formate hydrogenlyase subunit 3/multisubunit Na+/H+ antiporter MnhD subunit
MGLVPFQFGFITNQRANSVWISGFSAQAGLLAGSIALTRLLGTVFVGVGQSLGSLIIVFCWTTFLFTSLMSLRGFSPGIKSLSLWLHCLVLFEGSITGLGLMTLAAELERPAVRWGAFLQGIETQAIIVFVQLTSLLAFNGIFCTLEYLSRSDRCVEFLEDIKGLGRASPVSSLALIISLISLIGCPLTAGFWGQWLILLSAANVHIKWASNIFTPWASLRLLMLTAIVASLIFATIIVFIAREVFLESHLGRPIVSRGQGPFFAAVIAAAATLLLGIAPQLIFIPLKSIASPRDVVPTIPQRGSGKNTFGFFVPDSSLRESSLALRRGPTERDLPR